MSAKVKVAEKKAKKAEKKVEKAKKGRAPLKELKDGQCFYIVSAGKDGLGSDLAVEVDKQDYYHPKKTGIHNIHLGKFEKSKAQKWIYDSKTQLLSSLFIDGLVFFEGSNHNVNGYKNIGLPQQKFTFNTQKKQWVNSKTGRALDLEEKKGKKLANIVTQDKSSKNSQKWDIIMC